MNKLTTPMAILISGILIALVLFFKDDSTYTKSTTVKVVDGKWYETNCRYYQGSQNVPQNQTLNIRYKTGSGWEQRFYIGPFALEDVTTRKGYAYGKKCAAEGSCNQRVAEYTFNEVSRTLNVEVRDYSDRYIYQYLCGIQ
jgi:hypothetical protein